MITALLIYPTAAAGQEVTAYFEEHCGACHTIGDGELNGPDLKGVTRRREIGWLHRFISNPDAMVKAADPIAVELLRKYGDALMPTPEGLTPQLLDALILYIERQSSGDAAAQPEAPEAPFTSDDVSAGRALFTGQSPLSRGGAACNACHALGPVAALGGARLGPDLTFVSQRLKGRRGTTAWLNSPPTPMMRQLFADKPLAPEEVHAIAALFEHTGATEPVRERRVSPAFVASGLLGALLGLVLFDRTWKDRLSRVRTVRAPGTHRGHA